MAAAAAAGEAAPRLGFFEGGDVVQPNDTVVLYGGYNSMMTLKVTLGKLFSWRMGNFSHDDIIGARFGSKILDRKQKNWCHVFRPTPELWTRLVPHRTQILYQADIALVIHMLDLRPGSVVIESGTGSASLSHSLIRTVFPTGHLHTFEFHEGRADKARQELAEHGLSQNVTVRHADVCTTGFGLDAVADAVFLDLPKPWDAVDSATQALKPYGRMCSFSPCIEQVQEFCSKVAGLGYVDIRTFECLKRPIEIKRPPHIFQDLPPGFLPPDEPQEEEEEGDTGKGRAVAAGSGKRKADGDAAADADGGKGRAGKKRRRADGGLAVVTRPSIDIPGHTGFLTFATKISDLARQGRPAAVPEDVPEDGEAVVVHAAAGAEAGHGP